MIFGRIVLSRENYHRTILDFATISALPAAPHGFDIILTPGGVRQLPPQVADKHIDNFDYRFVHTRVKIFVDSLLAYRGPLAKAQKLQNSVLLLVRCRGASFIRTVLVSR